MKRIVLFAVVALCAGNFMLQGGTTAVAANNAPADAVMAVRAANLTKITSIAAPVTPKASVTVDGGVLQPKMALDKAQQTPDVILAAQRNALAEVKKSDKYQKSLWLFNNTAAAVRSKVDASIPKKLDSLVQAALVEFDKPVTDARAAVESAQKALNEVMKKHSSKDAQLARQKIVSGVQQSPAYVDLVKQSKTAAAAVDATIAALPEKVALDKIVFDVSDSFAKQLSAAKEKSDAARLTVQAPAGNNANSPQAQK